MKKIKLKTLLGTGFLIGSCAITSTLALVQETEQAVNTFSIGNITMSLDETDKGIGENGKYPLTPGVSTAKNPTVTIKQGSEPCYVFVYVDNTLNTQIDGFKDPITGENLPTTLDIDESDWMPVTKNGEKVPNMYRYKEIVNATTEQKDLVVFNKVTVNENVTEAQLQKLVKGTITVKAYAHQEEGIDLDIAVENAYTFFSK